jgi:biopolymer transport protein ExbD
MTSPFVAVGVALLGIVVMAAILSASANQMQLSVTTADSISIQNDKVKENIKATITEDGQLEIKNDWVKTTRIKEIRIVDDNGNIVLREALDAEIGSFRTSSLEPQIAARISEKINSIP